VANRRGHDVAVLLFGRDGMTQRLHLAPISAGPVALLSGDFNADGSPDLVTANQGSDDISVLLNQGTPEDHTRKAEVLALSPQGMATRIGSIRKAEEDDLFRFTGPYTGRMTVELRAHPLGGLDPGLALFDRQLKPLPLAVTRDSAQRLVRIEFRVTAGEEYFLRAAGRNGTSGAYSLELTTNTAPFSAGLPDLAVAGGPLSPIPLAAFFADRQDAAGALTYSLVGNMDPGLFQNVDLSAAGLLTLIPAAGADGLAVLTVRATDPGGLFTETSFVVLINPANDAPTFQAVDPAPFDLYAGAQRLGGFAIFDSGPFNERDQKVFFTVAHLSNPGLFAVPPAVDPDGVLTFVPAEGAAGVATFDLVITDAGGLSSSVQTITLTIRPINDPPEFTLRRIPVLVSAGAGRPHSFSFVTGARPGRADAQDEAGQDLTFTLLVTAVDGNLRFLVPPSLDSFGNLTFLPAPGSSGSVRLSVVATDNGPGGGLDQNTHTESVLLTVLAADQPPVLLPDPIVVSLPIPTAEPPQAPERPPQVEVDIPLPPSPATLGIRSAASGQVVFTVRPVGNESYGGDEEKEREPRFDDVLEEARRTDDGNAVPPEVRLQAELADSAVPVLLVGGNEAPLPAEEGSRHDVPALLGGMPGNNWQMVPTVLPGLHRSAIPPADDAGLLPPALDRAPPPTVDPGPALDSPTDRTAPRQVSGLFWTLGVFLMGLLREKGPRKLRDKSLL
jgi:hypothetical protein